MFQDHQSNQYLIAARFCMRIAIGGAAMLAVATSIYFIA
jgi:hypothetical protein